MFEFTSRYAAIEVATLTDSEGKEIPYKRRRFLPKGETMPLLTKVTVQPDDRLDVIAFKALGSAEQAWRVCDANDAMNPTDLTKDAGTSLRVPIPALS